MDRLSKGFAADSRRVSTAVRHIIDQVLAQRDVVLQLAEIRAMNDFVFGHSVGVCAVAVLLASHTGVEPGDLQPLAVGALLHDVGKIRIPDPIWNKPRKLTDEEFQIMQMHTMYGYEILRQQPWIDARSAHVAWEHHERWDGTGYPRRLKGEAIHRFARIVSVADVFDALTADRPYRPAWPIYKAIQFIREQVERMFEPRVVTTFLGRVAPYPIGEKVRLNTGDAAKVVHLNVAAPARPVVELLDAPGTEIDLSKDLSRRIVGPLDEEPAAQE